MDSYKKRLVALFLPIMISNLIGQVQMLIDRIFLGQMDILYMTAIGNASSTIWTTMSVIFSLGTGASILISQAVGEGDHNKAKNFTASMILYHNILPIILFAVWMFASPLIFDFMGVNGDVREYCISYARIYSPIFLLCGAGSSITTCFQTSGNTKPLVLYGLLRSGLNIFLDYALIFGNLGFPKMDIEGAALATTISEVVGGIYILVVIIRNKKLATKPSGKAILKAKFNPYFLSLKLGVNAALEDFAWNLGNLLILKILNSINDEAAGIFSIVFSMEMLSTVVIGALGSAVVTLTGEATGARDFKIFRLITKTAELWSIYVAAAALVLYCVIPETLLGFFTTDPAIIAGSVTYLILVGVNMFAKSANIVVGSSIRGSGNTRWMLITQCFGTVGVVGLAALMVYVFDLGMVGVFIAVLTDEALRAVVNLLRFLKIRFS